MHTLTLWHTCLHYKARYTNYYMTYTPIQSKEERGIIQIIIIVIIAVILLSILGYDPAAIWTEYVLPVLNWFWKLFISILDFIVTFVTQLIN